jgi:RNA polymerase sigma-70 factor (ECF subfamily)
VNHAGLLGQAPVDRDKERRMATDQGRFERVVMPHLDAVYRMARRLSGNEAEAEDLVQETFLRAHKAFEGFELREYGAKPWLLKILHNVFYTRMGKKTRQPILIEDVSFDDFAAELDQPPASELGSSGINWDDFDEELKAAVLGLSEDYREVILLWALEELSYKEIAEVCGCAIGTVMSRLYRARQQLGQRLAEYARQRGLESERFGE